MAGRDTKSMPCEKLILCGGKGTRLGDLGARIPKALAPLRGKPILLHKLEQCVAQGMHDIILAIGYRGDQITAACDQSSVDGRFVYSDSGEDASMLRRIYDARRHFGEQVIVSYGDSLANLDYGDLLAFHRTQESLLTLVTAPIQSPFGLVSSDEQGQVTGLEEKPVLQYYIGTFVVERQAFDYLPRDLIDWEDGTGLIAFFKILMAVGQLHNYRHDGLDITFNTVEELDAANDGFLKFHTHFK